MSTEEEARLRSQVLVKRSNQIYSGEELQSAEEGPKHVRVVRIQEDKPVNWVTERYQVRWPWVKTILNKLLRKKECPDIELFADPDLHLFKNWVGPGSPGGVEGSLQLSWKWSKIGLFWANPPFSRTWQVVKKIKNEKSYGILILPDWEDKS